MLDPSRSFTILAFPRVTIYPDHASPTRFYPIPAAPGIARDDQGTPQISLLLYGRQGTRTEITGGQLTLTTTLALGDDERERLRQALADQLFGEPSRPTTAPGQSARPGIELVSPDWRAGLVEVRLPGPVVLSGTPSLMNANTCVLMANLTAGEAQALKDAWADGLPGAIVAYRLETVAAASRQAREETRTAAETEEDGTTRRRRHDQRFHADVTQSVPYQIARTGPLTLSREARENGLQEVRW